MTDLLEQLLDELARCRLAVKDQYDRILPTNELLFDRWDKAALADAGAGSSLYDSCVVFGKVIMGENVWVGPFTVLDGFHATLSIGDHAVISSGVQIYTHDSVRHALSGGRIPHEAAPVHIGACTYVGSQCVISKGVEIGSHCVIGANSLVNRSIPDWSIAWGTPARVVGRVIEENGEYRFEYDR